MMALRRKKLMFFEDANAEVVLLDYKTAPEETEGPQYAALVALPKSEKSLDDLVSSLSGDFVTTWVEKFSEQLGTVKMPKFKVRQDSRDCKGRNKSK
jgi:hypothetical protein